MDFVSATAPAKPAETPEQKEKENKEVVEHLASSIVMGSLNDRAEDKKYARPQDKPAAALHQTLESITKTAKQFADELNKNERAKATEYKREADRLKQITDKILHAAAEKEKEEKSKSKESVKKAVEATVAKK